MTLTQQIEQVADLLLQMLRDGASLSDLQRGDLRMMHDSTQRLLKLLKNTPDIGSLDARQKSILRHDAGNPINALLGFSKLLLQPDADPLNDSQRQQLETIIEQSRIILQGVQQHFAG